MLNLVNLISSIAISIGVATATTTPISHAEEKPVFTPKYQQNIVQNYTANATITWQANENVQSVQDINNSNEANLNTGYCSDNKWNITATNTYINLIGNYYSSVIQKFSQVNDPLTRQFSTYYNNYLNIVTDTPNQYDFSNLWPTTTQSLYVLKFTSYNHNIDTQTHTQVTITINDDFYDQYTGLQTYIEDVWLYESVYTSSENDWDQYIDRQLTTNIVKTIKEDIEDVNNGFYYTKEESLWHMEDPGGTAGYQDYTWEITFDITLIPNDNTYVIINLMPLLLADNDNYEPYTTANVPTQLQRQGLTARYYLEPNQLSVTGTNIIPDQTYEVLDIPGLMWEILTMPFAFVSQAFNLTLFPNTPYQINISNLFLSVIAVFVFIWLISFLLKSAG